MRMSNMAVCAAAVLAVTSAAQAAIISTRIASPTAWYGAPTLTTGANPTVFTVGQGDGTDVWGQSFSVASTGTLSSIELAFSGCGGGATSLALYDVGTSNPASYTAGSLTNLLTNTAATINPSGTAQNIVYTFSGPDAVSLTAGHVYVFQFTGNNMATLLRSGSDLYSGGTLFKNGSPLNGNQRDIGMAVTVAVPEPATVGILAATSALFLRRRRQA